MATDQIRDFDRLFRSTPVMLHSIDADGRLLDVSDEWCRVLGYTREEVVGRPSIDFLSPQSAGIAEEVALPELFRTGLCRNKHYEFVSKDGAIVDILLSASLERHQDGSPRCARAVLIDISELIESQHERHKLEEKIQQGQKLESLGVLAGGIAHDFNNILMSILGWSDLAMETLAEDHPVLIHLTEIGSAAMKAAELCRSMLAYAGKARLETRPVYVHQLIQEIGHLLEVSISKRVQLKYRLDAKAKPVLADPAQLTQVIMNLITNASDAVGDARGTITIRCACREYAGVDLENFFWSQTLTPGSYVLLEVADTGRGMDLDTINKIFDPFFSTKECGRGLGLAAVLGIVKGHRGSLRVYSEAGCGSRVRVIFPVTDAPVQDPDAIVTQGRVEGGPSVLLVDDDADVLHVGCHMLEALGFSVTTATDGVEALRALAAGASFDAVILDFTMPKMDGRQTLLEMRRRGVETPVFLSSGYYAQDVKLGLAESGLAGFVQKPYTLDTLRRTLGVCFDFGAADQKPLDAAVRPTGQAGGQVTEEVVAAVPTAGALESS